MVGSVRRVTNRKGWAADAGRGLLDALFDVRCIRCRQPGAAWCEPCVRQAWSPQLSRSVSGLPLVSAARYEGCVQQALVAHKERGQLGLARPLGRLLARAVASLGNTEPVVLVACPSSARAVRERGQDHALRVAEHAARCLRRAHLEVKVASPLRLTGPVIDQVGLTVRERRANRRNSIIARSAPQMVAGVIIVDDVTTSGSTLYEADRALRAAGWPTLGSAVVARAGPQMGVASTGGLD